MHGIQEIRPGHLLVLPCHNDWVNEPQPNQAGLQIVQTPSGAEKVGSLINIFDLRSYLKSKGNTEWVREGSHQCIS